jgi:deoxyribodipyrimidine photolyase
MPEYARALVWFRRDLRNFDHAALYHALKQARDAVVEAALRSRAIAVHHYKDTVVFEREEVLTPGKTPFSIFTPYKNAWLKQLIPYDLRAFRSMRIPAGWQTCRRQFRIYCAGFHAHKTWMC